MDLRTKDLYSIEEEYSDSFDEAELSEVIQEKSFTDVLASFRLRGNSLHSLKMKKSHFDDEPAFLFAELAQHEDLRALQLSGGSIAGVTTGSVQVLESLGSSRDWND